MIHPYRLMNFRPSSPSTYPAAAASMAFIRIFFTELIEDKAPIDSYAEVPDRHDVGSLTLHVEISPSLRAPRIVDLLATRLLPSGAPWKVYSTRYAGA